MRSVLVSVKYKYCWVASGRALLNDFELGGFSAGAVGNTSGTTVAELFLEVIGRHVLGRMAGRIQGAITEWEFATLQCVFVRDAGFNPAFSREIVAGL